MLKKENELVEEFALNKKAGRCYFLENLSILLNYKKVVQHNVALIKTTSEESAKIFTENFFRKVSESGSSSNSENIGIRNFSKLVPDVKNDRSVIKFNFYEYNYVLGKKFKHLKKETISQAEIIAVVINIYDKRTIESLENSVEELDAICRPLDSQNEKRVNYVAILLKETNNFIEKLSERNLVEKAKKNLHNMDIKKVIEIESIEDNKIEDLLFEIVN